MVAEYCSETKPNITLSDILLRHSYQMLLYHDNYSLIYPSILIIQSKNR